VFNRDDAALGDVIGLIDTGPHCVLRVKPATAQAVGEAPAEPAADERLIPFVEAYVDSVDIAGRRIVVDWGLDY
jgi:16S rRNA processing protein RimM